MAFVLPRSIFVHVPKTGGQWVVSALEHAGVPVRPLGVVHTSPDEIADQVDQLEQDCLFVMVRHPLTWYQSIWAHRSDLNWAPVDAEEWFTPRWIEFWRELTASCSSLDFKDFVAKCVNAYPDGLVTTLYDAYTTNCHFVGHQEQLADDLVSILKQMGEVFDETLLRGTSPRNVRGRCSHWRRQSAYTRELVELVTNVEASVIERFGYEQVPAEIVASLEG